MKNQYFGDINDYKKYSLLRHLGGNGRIGIAVCWALTEADGRSDGKRIQYLEQPDTWRKYDPLVYDHLRHHVIDNGIRHVNVMQQANILANCRFYTHTVRDDIISRKRYFGNFIKRAEGADLVFLDPDNGLGVKSVPRGKKQSSKYVYWREVQILYKLGYSVLLYQHFPRKERDSFIRNLVQKIKGLDGIPSAVSYCTPHVVFLLLPQPHHEKLFIQRNRAISRNWGELIKIKKHNLANS